jgi:methionine-rich copper-binding protein CopC
MPIAMALLLVGAALVAPSSSAHTGVVATSPRAGSSLAAAPRAVTVTFSGQILRGTVTVRNGVGRKVSLGTGRRDPLSVRRLRVGLPAGLPAGAYRVRWTATTPDGHALTGVFGFRVR